MPKILSSTTTPILLAIKQRLIDCGVVPLSRVIIVGNTNTPKYQADQLVHLWPQNPRVNETIYGGAGRWECKITEPLMAMIWTRLNVDDLPQAQAALTDPVNGHYVLRSNIMSALIGFFPTDSNGNSLVTEEVKLTTGERAEKIQAPHDPSWCMSHLLFDVVYRQLLTRTQPDQQGSQIARGV